MQTSRVLKFGKARSILKNSSLKASVGAIIFVLMGTLCSGPPPAQVVAKTKQWSAARKWNEALLFAIRNDLARPTVHARNLFHTSAMMYDLWAVYDATASTYFFNRSGAGQSCNLSHSERQDIRQSTDKKKRERGTAISYAMYTLLAHRFSQSPGYVNLQEYFLELLTELGHNQLFNSRNYMDGGPQQRAAALGLYLADCVIAYGMADGANETGQYENQIYQPVNDILEPHNFGTPGMHNPDRWQPLSLQLFIDQSGNETISQPEYTTAEWGWVTPFALTSADQTFIMRDGITWPIYHDPGPPARLLGGGNEPDIYKWGHSLVVHWSSHLDPKDGVMWDISPGSIGNTAELPQSLAGLPAFYDMDHGGVKQFGHPLNPVTGEPYQPNVVPRGDYTRVLAEFWADGPESETPPGHWFVILNEAVSDHPDTIQDRRLGGHGPALGNLEWDVKAYFALGGAVHDAAITAWSIKAGYDYVRPISAVRYMASLGQSTDAQLGSYHHHGIPLSNGYIESIPAGDPLAGTLNENMDTIKVLAWQGTGAIDNSGYAGVNWLRAGAWVPYQRPTFVSPPFAGYVSGHSTFSRAAAEVLSLLTGSEFFPGGLAEFTARRNEFLVFEFGPSVDVVLQWATFVDAADQSGLSRIWGGIHPPIDDIPGRKIGVVVGRNAFDLADRYFRGEM